CWDFSPPYLFLRFSFPSSALNYLSSFFLAESLHPSYHQAAKIYPSGQNHHPSPSADHSSVIHTQTFPFENHLNFPSAPSASVFSTQCCPQGNGQPSRL